MSTSYGSLEEANQYPAEYANSILIIQPNNKNGPLKAVDYGIQRAEISANNDFTKPAGSTQTQTAPSMPSSRSY